ncbi:S-layer homology domain-containing protein [Paenibacillus nanensis]|nr:S-layer homology domain-containing protein [Paenibacillus nanensis]
MKRNSRLARLMLAAVMASGMLSASSSVTASAAAETAAEQNQIATSYSLSITGEHLQKGDTVEVAVQADGMIDVYAFEVVLAYDADKLKWLSAKTDVPGFSVKPIVEDGQVTLAHTLIGKVAGLKGSRELYKLRFEVLQPGESEVALLKVKEIDSKLASKTEDFGSGKGPASAGTSPFKDLAGYGWAEEAIAALASEGIIKGTTENTFSPSSLIKRADFLLLLMRTLELEAPKGRLQQRFPDVKAEVYYADSVAAAGELGIVKGDDLGLFHPEAPITRQEMMILTERALRAADRLSAGADISVLEQYKDRDLIEEYASSSIAVLTGSELVEGDSGRIRPRASANRAQAAVMMFRVYAYLQSEQDSPV